MVQMNLFPGQEKRHTGAENRHVALGGKGGWVILEIRIDIYTLRCKIARGKLLCGTGSSAWCSVMTLEMCIHITDPLCYTAEPNKKLQSNYTPIKSNNDFKRTIWRFLKKKLRTITWSRYPIPVHMSIENHNSKRYRQSHSNQNSMVLAHKQI